MASNSFTRMKMLGTLRAGASMIKLTEIQDKHVMVASLPRCGMSIQLILIHFGV